MRHHHILAVLCLVVFGPWTGGLSAQERTAPDLPDDPALWINASPPPDDAFAGKGVFLWFFEETCPRCAGRWPDLMAMSKKHQGRPIVFIAVNSGTPRRTIEAYIRKHKITWPVILDPGRQLEPLFNINEISLRNIYQVRLILPDGTWTTGSFNNLDGAIERAAANAQWKVDPEQIPEELETAWRAVEFGNYSAAASAIQKGLNNAKPEIKQAAELLEQHVEEQIGEQMTSAKEDLAADRKWEAYKTFKQISTRFKGYPPSEEAADSVKTLERDSAVERELRAMRILGTAQRALNGTPAGQRKAGRLLKSIQENFPGTEAAGVAEQQLQKL